MKDGHNDSTQSKEQGHWLQELNRELSKVLLLARGETSEKVTSNNQQGANAPEATKTIQV